MRASIAFLFLASNVSRELLQPVAAVVADRTFEVGDLHLLLVTPHCLLVRPFVQSLPFVREQSQAFVEQSQFDARKILAQRLTATSELIDLADQSRVTLTIRHQRCEQLDLTFGFHHRLVSPGQVVEMRYQRHDTRHHIEGFQHVIAHKIGQVADRLHRYGLVEQLQRLIVIDTEATAEPRAIPGETVFDLRPHRAQFLAQLGDVGTEMRKVHRNREITFRSDKQSRRLPVRLLHPEYLRQCHGLVVARVVEHPQNDRVGVGVAQTHRLGRAGDLVALGLVVAEYIGTQRPFPAVGAGGFVVGYPLRGHEQRRNRVYQC